MTIAILIVGILVFLEVIFFFGAIYMSIEDGIKECKKYTDEEHARLLTAIFNRDAIIEQLQSGEEVEV